MAGVLGEFLELAGLADVEQVVEPVWKVWILN